MGIFSRLIAFARPISDRHRMANFLIRLLACQTNFYPRTLKFKASNLHEDIKRLRIISRVIKTIGKSSNLISALFHFRVLESSLITELVASSVWWRELSLNTIDERQKRLAHEKTFIQRLENVFLCEATDCELSCMKCKRARHLSLKSKKKNHVLLDPHVELLAVKLQPNLFHDKIATCTASEAAAITRIKIAEAINQVARTRTSWCVDHHRGSRD